MLKDKPIKELIAETQRVLKDGMMSGLVDNDIPKEMMAALKEDVFLFSGCKTHIALKEVSGLLLDETEKIKSFQRFSQDVQQIYQDYNENYLNAEYQFAISSAQNAAKWSGFEEDGDRYNLQYRTAGDDRVRESHQALDGITLPLEDPFWSEYFPPNGWGCRCTTVQVRKGKYPESDSTHSIKKGLTATTVINAKGVDAGAIFRFNPGQDKVIFPPHHPYYKVKNTVSPIIEES